MFNKLKQVKDFKKKAKKHALKVKEQIHQLASKFNGK